MHSIKMSLQVAVVAALTLTQGCIATRDYVRETVDPVTGRVSRSEARLDQVDKQIGGLGTRIAGTESKFGQVEGRVGQVETKADKALADLGNLRLERRLVVDMKDGATFGNNSVNLSPRARKEVDGFLDARKSNTGGTESQP